MYIVDKPSKSKIRSVEKVEGERIEQKIARIVHNGEPIKDGAPEIYSERKDGVISAYNIRTDRWEIATDAMDKVAASVAAKREHKADLKIVGKEEKTGKADIDTPKLDGGGKEKSRA